jgi:hypothetical protein
VDAQQVEQMVAASASFVMGMVFLFLEPARLPEPIRGLAERLGRWRKILGVAFASAGVLLVVATAFGM